MRRALLGLLAVVSLLLGLAAPASAVASVPLPRSMASTGDSITRAFDATPSGCFLVDCPQYSWSTGSSTSVNSHYRRILSQKPAIAKHVHNDAKSGAKMADLGGQLSAAASQGVEYVTVLMGANDLCTSSTATMTPTMMSAAMIRRLFAGEIVILGIMGVRGRRGVPVGLAATRRNCRNMERV